MQIFLRVLASFGGLIIVLAIVVLVLAFMATSKETSISKSTFHADVAGVTEQCGRRPDFFGKKKWRRCYNEHFGIVEE